MKVILTMAMSVNGMIADENGREDFLAHENWLAFIKLANKVGNFIYGRKTYEAVSEWPPNYLKDLNNVTKIVISQDESLNVQKGFVRVENPKQAILYLEKSGFDEVLVAGGSTVYSSFLKEGLASEIIVYANPIVLGSGKPIFNLDIQEIKLDLLGKTEIGNGIIELCYKVLK